MPERTQPLSKISSQKAGKTQVKISSIKNSAYGEFKPNDMLKNGVLDDMDKKGIEWVFIGSVDNILLKNLSKPLEKVKG